MQLQEYTCEHPTIAGQPCAICAAHFAAKAATAKAVVEPNKQLLSDWKPRWQCAVRQRKFAGAEIQDCDWPVCGCDPYADKVLDAIAESGFKIIKENRPHWARVRSALQAAKDCLQPYSKIEYGADNTPQPNAAFDVAQMCREAIYEMDQLAAEAGDGVAECPDWKDGI